MLTLKMRGAVLAVAATAALGAPAAQAKDLAASIQGKWAVDKATAMVSVAGDKYKNAPPEQQKAMRDGMPDMLLEFTATTVTTNMGGPPQVAPYKVLKSEKTKVWLEVAPTEKSSPTTDKVTIEFVNPDRITMSTEGQPLVLQLDRMKK